MKYVYSDFDIVFDTSIPFVNTLIVENPNVLREFLININDELQGYDGKSVLSINDELIPISKNLELISDFISFDLNKKALLSKITTAIDKFAMDENHYLQSMEMLGKIEKYLYDVSFDLNCDIEFSSLSIQSIIKSSGLQIRDSYDSLGEKIIDYFELIREFDKDKLFLTFNLRCFLNDAESEQFIDTVIRHKYHVIMIECCDNTVLSKEKRTIIDKNICVIT